MLDLKLNLESSTMKQNYHIGLLTIGKDFLDSANKLNDGPQWLAASLSVYYLYFHSIELAIKSFIYLKIECKGELRNIGHNLNIAWQKASELGIEKIYPENRQLQECIRMINHTYHKKELEYFFEGFKQLPSIESVKNACNCLFKALDQNYKHTLKESLQARRLN